MTGVPAMRNIYRQDQCTEYWYRVWLEEVDYLNVLLFANKTDICDNKTVGNLNKTENSENKTFGNLNKTDNSDNKTIGNLNKTDNSDNKTVGNLNKTDNIDNKTVGNLNKTDNSDNKKVGNLNKTDNSDNKKVGNLNKTYIGKNQTAGYFSKTNINLNTTGLHHNKASITNTKTGISDSETNIFYKETTINKDNADNCNNKTTLKGITREVSEHKINNVDNNTYCCKKKSQNKIIKKINICYFCVTRIAIIIKKASNSVILFTVNCVGNGTFKKLERLLNGDYCSCPSGVSVDGPILDRGADHITSYFAAAAVSINSYANLLVAQSHIATMGTSCSTNPYDRRDWSNIESGGKFSSVIHGKRESFRSRAQSDPTYNSARFPSDVCNCRLHNNSRDDEPSSFQSNSLGRRSDKRSSVSSNDSLETSPNVTNTSFQSRLSRVVGSMRSRTTSNCDVSPHRLLTRRSNYPNYRSTNHDYRSPGSFGLDRQRSQSWSNGRLGYADNYRPNPCLRTPGLYSVRGAKGSSSQTSGKVVSKFEDHKPGCPLHIKPKDSSKVSTSKKEHQLPEDLKDNWTPIQRRRAASESQTLRGRRLHRGELDDNSLDSSHEHAHVHWADEEKGSALSTSVIVTSVRPRSFSHDGAGGSPTRPILKKVTGF